MVNPILLAILRRKIESGEINPNTGEPFSIDDVKIQEYRDALTAGQ